MKRLISFFLTLIFLVAIPLSARYRYNPYTKKLDYYEPAADVDLGDIGDITLTGLATGDVLYYSGAAWVNLGVGANGEILTLAGGIPSWAAGGAPAAHAASHEVGGADLIDHDAVTGLGDDDHLQYGERTQAESVTGLWNFIASGVGGVTDYDITIGDVATPDYGIARIGNSIIGRTSYNVPPLDIDGAVIFHNVGGPVTGPIQFVWIETSGPDAIRFAIPKSGAGNATYNPRSMLIAGPAVNDDDIVTVGYWQTTNSIFDNLACDTTTDGADLGVQNDLEVEGDIFTDSIKESTAAAGITFANETMFTAGTSVNEYSIDGTLAGNSDDAVPTEKAVKTYVDTIPRENLLTNSGLGVSSQSVLTDIDAQINVTDITAGVCTTVDTQSLQVGDLVKFNGGGSTGTDVYEITALVTDTTFTIHDTTITDPTNVNCDEATPAFIAADVYAPDSWTKTNTLDLYRWFNHTTYHKGMYAQQTSKGVDTAEYLNAFGSVFDKDYHYLEYRGRTVTFGCWVYSVTAADNVKLQINDSDGTTESSFVVADTLTWVEISRTCGATIASLTPRILFDGDTADVAYISYPMLVLGLSIGEGNYAPKLQETIWLEKNVPSNTYDNTSDWGDIAAADLNIEADSDGMLPKGAKLIAVHCSINDSGSGAGLDVHLQLRKDATADFFYCNSVAGKTNNVHSHKSGIQPCDVNGDVDIHLNATGADTLDIGQFEYHGVQIN